MFIFNNDTRTIKSYSLIQLLLLITLNLFALTQVRANELNDKQFSVSHGIVKKELSEQQRSKIINTNKIASQPDQRSGRATAKTRATMLETQNKSDSNISQDFTADFAIYGATSRLQDDLDGDSFYQTFSISFDADIYSYADNQVAEVYALLYLSKNGGPWTHYFTTDSFLIEGDSDADEYEVITTFLSGYEADYYDVLIDLYQVGYKNVVATYSSDDSNALYALSLESADYDEPYIEEYVEVIEINGGASYWLMLFLLSVYFIRSKVFINTD